MLPVSPQSGLGLNLEHINISHSRFCNSGPVSRPLFTVVEVWHAFAEASHTIPTFVVPADSLIIGLCSKQNTLSLTVLFNYSTSTFPII